MRWKLPLACSSLLAVALVFAGTALAGDGGIAPPAESPNAERIRDLYWLVLAVTGVIFVIVEGALIMFVVKYRNAGRPREEEGPQIRGHSRLELIWSVVPALILVGIITFVFYKLPGIKNVPDANAAGPRITIQVQGRQFYWLYTYPNGAVSVDELRLPAGRPIDLEISAPVYDVAHSWWVPALAGKMDAIPGKVNHLEFETPSRPGLYKGQCAEFCGVQHALMFAQVQTMQSADYETWVSNQLQAGTDVGKQTFEGACAPCHGLDGKGLIGPPLAGNATLAQGKLLVQLLVNGKNAMPPVGKDWDTRQRDALIEYVQKRFVSGG
ncbi:MAG: cytochrome c oxidase subunit II [Actinomycetota bacterium]